MKRLILGLGLVFSLNSIAAIVIQCDVSINGEIVNELTKTVPLEIRGVTSIGITGLIKYALRYDDQLKEIELRIADNKTLGYSSLKMASDFSTEVEYILETDDSNFFKSKSREIKLTCFIDQ